MPYIIKTDINDYNNFIKTKTVSLPFDSFNLDLEKIGINDFFYFYINDKKIIQGPYITTSKHFSINNESEKLFCFFFEAQDQKNIRELSLNTYPGIFLNDEDFSKVAGDNDKKQTINNSGVLIIDENDYNFTLSYIFSGNLSRLTVKISPNWFKELIALKEKIIFLSSGNNINEVNKLLKEFSDILYSFFIKDNEKFWQQIRINNYIYFNNRSNLIPFRWMLFKLKNYGFSRINFSQSYINLNSNKTIQDKINSIIIISDPTNTLPSAQIEGRRLYDFFSKKNIKADIISRELTFVNIKSYFEKYDIVHFIGHGEGGWKISEKRKLNPQTMPVISKAPYIVVSHSCNTAQNLGQPLLTEKFLNSGTSFVIASDIPVPDKSFYNFFSRFYKTIFNQVSPNDSFSDNVSEQILNNQTDWIYFTLYENRNL